MTLSLNLTRYKLESFLRCRRQFQLRFVTELPWPAEPVNDELAARFDRGERFHRLLERHFLGIAAEPDDDLRGWWRAFRDQPPPLPPGARYPEYTLTRSAGAHSLFGRFDLLVLSPTAAHIFDWKTSAARTVDDLRHDWQTRLYLALIAAAGDGLDHAYAPEQIALTYWFAERPEAPVTLRYNSDWFRRDWAIITATLGRIDRLLQTPTAIWPLTDDRSLCARCNFRAFCGRLEPPIAPDPAELEARHDDNRAASLEPELP